jgi:hypothetical protein
MSVVQMLIANIQSLSDSDRSTVLAAFHGVSATVVEPKVKKDHANKGKPTCYSDFVAKVIAEKKDEFAVFIAANPDKKRGGSMTFVSMYKKEHTDEYMEFEKAWNEAHPKPEVMKPELVEGADAKPKRTISDEQKAAMKAGREAKRALKTALVTEAPVIQETVPVIQDAVPVEQEASVADKKKRQKDSERYTPEELVAVKAARAAKREAKKATNVTGAEDSGNTSDSTHSVKSKTD